MLVIGKEVVSWVAKRTNEFGNFGTDIGIGWERGGKLVAGTAFANWNQVNIEAHIAAEGKHCLTREYLWTIFDYPFNQLKVRRVTLCIGEGNKPSRRFAEHLGFILEAELADAHPTGKLCIYRQYRHECRFLQVRHEKLAE